MMRRKFSHAVDASFFWTDSTIVLAYICNKKRRFHTYIANRLFVVHTGSSVDQWNHVPTESDRQDDVTRGVSMPDLINRRQWFHEPESLFQQTIREEVEPPGVSIDDDRR